MPSKLNSQQRCLVPRLRYICYIQSGRGGDARVSLTTGSLISFMAYFWSLSLCWTRRALPKDPSPSTFSTSYLSILYKPGQPRPRCRFPWHQGSRHTSARAASKGTPRNGSWKPGARSPYTEQPAAGRERKAVPAPASEAARRGQGGTQPWRRAWPYVCCWVGVGRAQPSQQGLVNDLLRRASWWPERLLLHKSQGLSPVIQVTMCFLYTKCAKLVVIRLTLEKRCKILKSGVKATWEADTLESTKIMPRKPVPGL